MILIVPIPDKKSDISIWFIEWHRDNITIVNNYTTITTGSSLEVSWREIEKASNLILDLELVSPVPTGWNRAICAQNSILPWIFSLLNSIPAVSMNYAQIQMTNKVMNFQNSSRILKLRGEPKVMNDEQMESKT